MQREPQSGAVHASEKEQRGREKNKKKKGKKKKTVLIY
jgi:hypothetical protein